MRKIFVVGRVVLFKPPWLSTMHEVAKKLGYGVNVQDACELLMRIKSLAVGRCDADEDSNLDVVVEGAKKGRKMDGNDAYEDLNHDEEVEGAEKRWPIGWHDVLLPMGGSKEV